MFSNRDPTRSPILRRHPRGAEVVVSWAKVVEFAEEKSPVFFGGKVFAFQSTTPKKMLNTLLKFNSSPLKVTGAQQESSLPSAIFQLCRTSGVYPQVREIVFFGSIVLEHIRDFFHVNLGRFTPRKKTNTTSWKWMVGRRSFFWGGARLMFRGVGFSFRV